MTTISKKGKVTVKTPKGEVITDTKAVVVKQDNEVTQYLGKVGLIEKPTGKQIVALLSEFFTAIDEWTQEEAKIVVTDETHTEAMEKARSGRISLMKKRTALEKLVIQQRKLEQEKMADIKLLDTTWLKSWQIMEANLKNLEGKLKIKEEFIERKETARKLALSVERIEKMNALEAPVTGYDFGEMDEERWNAVHESAIQAKKDREDLETLRQEKDAETKRLAAEATKLIAENQTLKATNQVLETVVSKAGLVPPTPNNLYNERGTFGPGVTMSVNFGDKDATDKQKLLTFAETIEDLDYKLEFKDPKVKKEFDGIVYALEEIVDVLREIASKLK